MEGGRSLEINVISARGIKNMIGISRMKVYVVVYLKAPTTREKHQEVESRVDREGGVNPTWNFRVNLRVAELLAQQNALNVVFKLKRDGTVVDRVAGKVKVPVRELLAKPPSSCLSYQVRPQGMLNISYNFTDEIPATSSISEEEEEQPPPPPPLPPVGPSSSSSAPPYAPYYYPRPNPGYTYPPPSDTGYTYPRPDPGYTYPPPSDTGYTYPRPDPGYNYPPPPPDPDNRRRRRRRPRLHLPSWIQLGLLTEELVSDDETYDDDHDA